MGRIIALDYGTVRVGIAVTDPGQIIATGLATVPAKEVMAFLTDYIKKEDVESIVVGDPRHLDNTPAQNAKGTKLFIEALKKAFPNLPVYTIDERFTSRMAFQAMIDGGLKKKDRRDKAMIDKVSATIILQSYMEIKKNDILPKK